MPTPETPEAESIEQLARRTFAELHRAIIFHETGALAGSVESIHDMRVSIRRLRVALSNFAFCLPRDERKRLRATLEHLANALGHVRDLDVMIELMKATMPNRSEPERAALAAVIRRLKARRRHRLRALIAYLHGDEYAGFKRQFPSETAAHAPENAIVVSATNPHSVQEEHGQAA